MDDTTTSMPMGQGSGMHTHSTMSCVAGGVAIFVIGLVLGVVLDPHLPAAISPAKTAYQSGFTAAKTLAQSSGIVNGAAEVRGIIGTVTAVSGTTLTLRTTNPNPFDDPSLTTRTVVVSASTTVVKIASTAALTAKATTTKSGLTMLGSTPAHTSDIQVGDVINIFTLMNIKTLKEFPALVIQILPKKAQ